MDWSAALPIFIITLREGVEATLVVGIVLAYLDKAQQTQFYPWVWSGVAAGLLGSGLVGALFSGLWHQVGTGAAAALLKPLLEAILGCVAIALLSWMLIWMTQQARRLKAEVEAAVAAAVSHSPTPNSTAGWGIFGIVFSAVLREGFETVVFVAATVQQGWMPALGAIAGLLGAVAIGFLLFRLGIRINLRGFFIVMGIFLLLIVAGLVVGALRHFDIALTQWDSLHPAATSLCLTAAPNAACILGPLVWNTSQILPARQFPGIILHTLFGYEDKLYLVQAVSYGLFLLTVGGIYLQGITGWQWRRGRSPHLSP